MASLSNTAKYRKLTALGCKIKIFIYLYFQIKTSDFRFACAVGNINHVIKNCMLKDYHMINILIYTNLYPHNHCFHLVFHFRTPLLKKKKIKKSI